MLISAVAVLRPSPCQVVSVATTENMGVLAWNVKKEECAIYSEWHFSFLEWSTFGVKGCRNTLASQPNGWHEGEVLWTATSAKLAFSPRETAMEEKVECFTGLASWVEDIHGKKKWKRSATCANVAYFPFWTIQHFLE